MKTNIFLNHWIPIIIFVAAILIFLSNFISSTSTRKVVLNKRTKKKHAGFRNVIYNKVIDRLHNFEKYNELVDKGQFIFGFFSADSEIRNRQKAEKFIIKVVFFNIILIIFLIFLPFEIVTKVFTVFIIILFEYFFIHNSILKKQYLLRDSFHILVREFIEGYVLNKNIQTAFEYSTKSIPPIYQVHVNRLINQLSSTTGKTDAFTNFNARIDYDLCSCFISIIESAYSTNENIVDNLLELQEIINKERISDKNKRTKLSAIGKNIWLWIIASLTELIFVGYYAKTSTGNYFLTTEVGQALLVCNIIFILISIISMIIADSI